MRWLEKGLSCRVSDVGVDSEMVTRNKGGK